MRRPTYNAVRRIKLLFCALIVITAGCASIQDVPDRPVIRGLDLPEAIVLKVQVEEWSETGYVPPHECEEGTICLNFYYWGRYSATVIEKLRGQWKGRTVVFARVEHAPIAGRRENDFFVVLRKLPPEMVQKLQAEFEVLDLFVGASQNDVLKMRQPVGGS
jgi:hypothetical protein